MIKGIGVDIVNNMRFKNPDLFINKILSDYEKKRYSEFTDINAKRCYLGARFAAKEALFKATNKLIPMNEVSVLNRENGAPYIFPEIKGISLSISHETEYSVAYVIWEE